MAVREECGGTEQTVARGANGCSLVPRGEAEQQTTWDDMVLPPDVAK